MSVILSTSQYHNGQEMEIYVKYDPSTNTAGEIKNIRFKTHGHQYPVGDFMVAIPEFEEAVSKIIDKTNWRELYRDKIASRKAFEQDIA